MYAMLGDVRFELLQSFSSMEAEHQAHFAKHEVLKGRPRLQAMGNELTTLRFALKLHWRLGSVDAAYKGLLAAKEAQQAVSLVYGSGRFVGWFVIESLTDRTLIQDAHGRTAARELDVSLTEFVGDPNNPLPTPGVMNGRQNPLLSLLPESVQAQASELIQAIETGVEIYHAAEDGIGQVQGLISAAKQLKNDPAGLLNLMGDALAVGSSTLGRLNMLPSVTGILGDLQGAADFIACTGQAANQLGSAVAGVRSGIESGSIGGWVDAAGIAIDGVAASLGNAACASEMLTGWVAVRKDDGR